MNLITSAYARGVRLGEAAHPDLPRCTCRVDSCQAHEPDCLRGIAIRDRDHGGVAPELVDEWPYDDDPPDPL